MIYRLIFLNGPLAGQRFTVDEAPMALGRAPDCRIIIPDADVALQHAIVEQRRDGLFIRDMGSMNRIVVNNREVVEARLKHGDEVELGKIRFLVQAMVQADLRKPMSRRKKRILRALRTVAILGIVTFGWWLSRPEGRLWLVTLGEPEWDYEAPIEYPPILNPPPAMAANPVEPEPPPPAVVAVTNTVTEVGVAPSDPDSAGPDVMSELLALRAQVNGIESRVQEITNLPATYVTAPPEPPPGLLLAPAPGAESAPAEAGRIVIAGVEMRRFPGSDDVADMRALTIELRAAGSDMIRGEDVRVDAFFFEKDPASGAVTAVRRSSAPVMVEPGEWARGALRRVAAGYTRPAGEGSAYYGYHVRVYLGGQLQDERARPLDLMDLFVAGTAAESPPATTLMVSGAAEPGLPVPVPDPGVAPPEIPAP